MLTNNNNHSTVHSVVWYFVFVDEMWPIEPEGDKNLSIGQNRREKINSRGKGAIQNFDMKIVTFIDRLQLCDWSILFFPGLLSPSLNGYRLTRSKKLNSIRYGHFFSLCFEIGSESLFCCLLFVFTVFSSILLRTDYTFVFYFHRLASRYGCVSCCCYFLSRSTLWSDDSYFV